MSAEQTTALAEIPIGPRGLQMRNVGDLMTFIRAMKASGMAPDNKGDNDLLIRAHYGMSIGLDPMRAVQSIYVVRNRPCVWGAAVPGLILSSGKCRRWEVTQIGAPGTDSFGVQVVTERSDIAGLNTFAFTMADARAAGLLNKDTWRSYPLDMMRWKAIGRAAGAVYGDVLYGLGIVENERDIDDMPRMERADAVVVDEPRMDRADAIVVDEPLPAIAPAPAPEPHPADLKDRFAAACEASGVVAREYATAIMQSAGAATWAEVPVATIEQAIVGMQAAAALPPAPVIDEPPAPVTVTIQHPAWARLQQAAAAIGLNPSAVCGELMEAHETWDAALVPSEAIEARAAELEARMAV